MDTTDIDTNAPPEQRRCTAHLFEPFPGGIVTSGSILQVSHTRQFSPAMLFDIVYAGAVLHHFGTLKLRDRLNKDWKDIFYPGGVTTARDAEHRATNDTRAANEEKIQNQAQERQERFQAHHGLDIP